MDVFWGVVGVGKVLAAVLTVLFVLLEFTPRLVVGFRFSVERPRLRVDDVGLYAGIYGGGVQVVKNSVQDQRSQVQYAVWSGS